jgi:hypothetical protein
MGFLVIGTYVMVLTVYAAGAAYHRKSKRAQGKERASPMSLVARAQKARKRRQSKSELEEEEETAAAGSEGFVVPPPPSSTPPPLLDEGEEKENEEGKHAEEDLTEVEAFNSSDDDAPVKPKTKRRGSYRAQQRRQEDSDEGNREGAGGDIVMVKSNAITAKAGSDLPGKSADKDTDVPLTTKEQRHVACARALTQYHSALWRFRHVVIILFALVVGLGAWYAQRLEPAKQMMGLLSPSSNLEMMKQLDDGDLAVCREGIIYPDCAYNRYSDSGIFKVPATFTQGVEEEFKQEESNGSGDDSSEGSSGVNTRTSADEASGAGEIVGQCVSGILGGWVLAIMGALLLYVAAALVCSPLRFVDLERRSRDDDKKKLVAPIPTSKSGNTRSKRGAGNEDGSDGDISMSDFLKEISDESARSAEICLPLPGVCQSLLGVALRLLHSPQQLQQEKFWRQRGGKNGKNSSKKKKTTTTAMVVRSPDRLTPLKDGPNSKKRSPNSKKRSLKKGGAPASPASSVTGLSPNMVRRKVQRSAEVEARKAARMAVLRLGTGLGIAAVGVVAAAVALISSMCGLCCGLSSAPQFEEQAHMAGMLLLFAVIGLTPLVGHWWRAFGTSAGPKRTWACVPAMVQQSAVPSIMLSVGWLTLLCITTFLLTAGSSLGDNGQAAATTAVYTVQTSDDHTQARASGSSSDTMTPRRKFLAGTTSLLLSFVFWIAAYTLLVNIEDVLRMYVPYVALRVRKPTDDIGDGSSDPLSPKKKKEEDVQHPSPFLKKGVLSCCGGWDYGWWESTVDITDTIPACLAGLSAVVCAAVGLMLLLSNEETNAAIDTDMSYWSVAAYCFACSLFCALVAYACHTMSAPRICMPCKGSTKVGVKCLRPYRRNGSADASASARGFPTFVAVALACIFLSLGIVASVRATHGEGALSGGSSVPRKPVPTAAPSAAPSPSPSDPQELAVGGRRGKHAGFYGDYSYDQKGGMGLAVEQCARVEIMWGVRGADMTGVDPTNPDAVGKIEYQPGFGECMEEPQAQEAMLEVCDRLKHSVLVKYDGAEAYFKCMIIDLKNWLETSIEGKKYGWPTQCPHNFGSRRHNCFALAVEEYLQHGSLTSPYADVVGLTTPKSSAAPPLSEGVADTQLLFMMVSLRANFRGEQTASKVLPYHQDWELMLRKINTMLPNVGACGDPRATEAIHASETWVRMALEMEFVSGTRTACIVATVTSAAAVLVFVRDVQISLLVLLTVSGMLCAVLGSLVVMDIGLGFVEAVSLGVVVVRLPHFTWLYLCRIHRLSVHDLFGFISISRA